MRRRTLAYVAASSAGGVRSVRHDRAARFAGIALPGTARQQALTVGTPLSAPPPMLAALLIADARRRPAVVRGLAAAMLVGILGEADTWSALAHPRRDPLVTACVLADVVLPASLLLRP